MKKIIFVLALLTSTAHAARDREISVSGNCTRQVTPDRAAITLTAEFTDPELKVASRKATEIYERARDSVKRLNLEALDLRTAEYSVNEVREWEKNRAISRGFRARMGLRVSSAAIARMGEVIAIASKEGMRDVGHLTTFLSDERLLKEQFSCLQEAAENARAKAEKLASALGAKIGEPVTLQENTTGSAYQPSLMNDSMMVRGGDAGAQEGVRAPTVESGRQELTVSVQAVFALK